MSFDPSRTCLSPGQAVGRGARPSVLRVLDVFGVELCADAKTHSQASCRKREEPARVEADRYPRDGTDKSAQPQYEIRPVGHQGLLNHDERGSPPPLRNVLLRTGETNTDLQPPFRVP